MSYDLYVKAKGTKSPEPEDYRAYFGNRKWYNVQGNQAWYENADTQVYFSFQWSDDRSDFIAEDEYPEEYPKDLLAFEFNINLLRPHVFGCEASIELERLASELNLHLFDPQTEPFSLEEFSKQSFKNRYERSNRHAIEAAGRETPEILHALHRMAAKTVENTWEWNYMRDAISQQETRDIFIPRVIYLLVEGNVRSCVVWTDGIPIMIPEVDLIIIHRDDLLPRRIFGKASRHSPVAFDSFRDLICEYPSGDSPMKHWVLHYDRPPKNIRSRFLNSRPEFESYELVPLDQILDAD